jgi:RNA polymerase sigma-70 factor, ECF subfamily
VISERHLKVVGTFSEEDMVQDEDMQAVAALRSGDTSGLRLLVGRYQLPALSLAFNLCGHQQVAEDAVADAFLAVHRHIGSYDTSRPFAPWFYRIVINAVRSAGRRDRRLPTVGDARELLVKRPDAGPGPEMLAIQSELQRALLKEIDLLPEKHREVIVLRYYLDMDQRAMAEALRVPIGTVKWRLFQARKRLRFQLHADEGVSRPLTEEAQG